MMNTLKDENIVILGISDRRERYSNKAYEKLKKFGYSNLIGVSPRKPNITGLKVFGKLKEIKENIHTITIYVAKDRLKNLIEDILEINPKRIILNPGTENSELSTRAKEADIEVVSGCTLVMLSTNQF